MKIKEQTRKLAAGCSKHVFEVIDRTDEVSSKHGLEVADKTDEVNSKHIFEFQMIFDTKISFVGLLKKSLNVLSTFFP